MIVKLCYLYFNERFSLHDERYNLYRESDSLYKEIRSHMNSLYVMELSEEYRNKFSIHNEKRI